MKTADTSRQLDLFRGFAAILMVLNHAGNAWLSRQDGADGIDGTLVFIGSAAPALFFSATGIGMGLSPRRSPDWRGVGRKVLLLAVADLFLGWGEHRWIGLDFFAFCAISMLAVSLVVATRRPMTWAMAAIAAIIVLRYGLVGRLQPFAQQHPAIAFVTGIDGVIDVSYPLSPWLVFPLGGFILGRVSTFAVTSTRIGGVLCILAGLSAVASHALVSRGGHERG